MKEIIKTILILSVIALVAGGLLGVVNHFTQIDEDEALAAKIQKTGIYSGDTPLACIEPCEGEGWDFYETGAINKVFEAKDTFIIHCIGYGGYGGDVELLINITSGKIIKYVAYKAEETPGLGTKAFEDSYANQYVGKDINLIEKFVIVKKQAAEDHQITAITGATKSSNAVLNAVNAAISWYKGYTEEAR